MNTEQEREAFEAEIRENWGFAKLERVGGDYIDPETQGLWGLWKARAALQSQDRARLQFLAYEGCSINSRERPDGGWEYQIYWEQVMKWQDDWFDSPEEAIDHARRIEENK